MAHFSESLERYLPIVDAPEAFRRSWEQPLSPCLWWNPLKAGLSPAQGLSDFPGAVPIAWLSNAWRLPGQARLGATLAHQGGWFYLQEEIAMAAVAALDPQPGEQILDLCAAPGGKTAQIALRVGSRGGGVVANDFHTQRLPQLVLNLARLGLTNVAVCHQNGRHWLSAPHSFDRVLVDVPCSGEGQLRRRMRWNPRFSRRIQRVQMQLLNKALDWVKPGGILLYSTCTFAPEENEAVLHQVLGDRGQVVPVDIPGLRAAPGLSEWQGTHFRRDLRHGCRYWPHLNGTGGFFLAKIVRSTESLQPRQEPKTPDFPVAGGELEWFLERYGVAERSLPGGALLDRGSKLYLSCYRPPVEPQVLGLPLLQRLSRGLKPTTAGLQLLGLQLRCNCVELSHEAALKFACGQDQPWSGEAEEGFVHVRHGPYQLGCGLYRDGELRSQLPKSLRLPAWVAEQA